MDTLMWHGGGMFFLSGEEFSSCGAHIIFCSTYTSVHPPNIFQHYFVGIGYSITCTFACVFSIIFLVGDAYCNWLLGCSSDEEFINTFADVLMNELEMMGSQFAQSMYIV